MNRSERILSGVHGFDFHWWIFDVSFSMLALRDIKSPRWLAKLLCRLGKHAWWIADYKRGKSLKYKCEKCGVIREYR